MHLPGYWHFDAVRVREVHRGVGGEYSFGDHAVHACDDVWKLATAAKFHADAAVARKPAGAGEHQVAKSCQARHGFSTPPASRCQSRDFSQTSRDQRSDRVVAETQAIADSSSDGDDVFERAPQFHANHIVIGVNAKRWISKLALHRVAQSFVR